MLLIPVHRMMDRAYIDANHIVDRYLAGQLSEDESREFECFYLDHPDMLEELHTQQALREAMVSESGLLPPAAKDNSRPFVSLSDRIADWLSPKPLLALSGLLTVGMATLLVQNAQLRRNDVAEFASYDTLLLQQVRGAETPVVTHPIDTDQPVIKLHIELGPVDAKVVEVSIYNANDKQLWTDQSAFDDKSGVIELMLNSDHLDAGQYRITVSQPGQADPDTSIATYQLKLTSSKL